MPDTCRIRGILSEIKVDTTLQAVTTTGETYSVDSGPQAVIDFGPLGYLKVDLDRLPITSKVGDLFIATITPDA